MRLANPSMRVAWIALASFVHVTSAVASDGVDFNRDVRPILADHCFACHGPDKNQRKADLRLDIRAVAVDTGALVPGNPDESELVARINAPAADDELMPPKKMNKPLSASQRNILKRWIAEGAPYAAHWSFTPIVRPRVPAVNDASKIHNPIDSFIQANLQKKALAYAPEADRRTLIRRLSLDLTGLPPATDEVRAFVENKDDHAYERLVKRLLDSPHYGERMAVPWLDSVRYADTVGYHGDQNQNVWAYRDYVVNAYNKNMPFDRFTIEQLAGDLLPNATPEQRAATCCNRLNMVTREGGAQPKEYLAKAYADRVRTVGIAWLGLTTGCAECHDHKFDPFSARDFYSLAAFFADLKQWGVYADYGYTPNPDLRGYNNDYPFPPEVVVDSPALANRIERANAQIDEIVVHLRDDVNVKAMFDAWRKTASAYLKANPTGWESPLLSVGNALAPPRVKGKAAAATKAAPAVGPKPEAEIHDDGSVTVDSKALTNDEFRLNPAPGMVAAIRIELLPLNPGDMTILRPGLNAALTRVQATLTRKGASKPEPIALGDADADRAVPQYRSGFEAIGIVRGWKIDPTIASRALTGLWQPLRPIEIHEGDILTVTVGENPAARVRVSITPFGVENLKHPTGFETLAAALDQSDAATSPMIRRAYLRATAWDVPAFDHINRLDDRIRQCRESKTPVLTVEAIPPAIVRILPRGNWQDETGPIVLPAVPHFLPQPTVPTNGARLTRLDLARWLVAPENPLTARVYVNRLWKLFLGAGLSATVDDLGAQGEWPLHPELLDWLAAEFRESGWNVKHLVELIVTSHTYRQGSNPRPEVAAIDPTNRWLASQSPRRLDAEFVRDNALSIAGLLNLEVGGPPCFPYQPDGYYTNIQFPDRQYSADPDERQYRRGLYMHWQRTFLHPMLAAFDAPSPRDCHRGPQRLELAATGAHTFE